MVTEHVFTFHICSYFSAYYVQARHTMCRRGTLCVGMAHYVQARHTMCRRGILCVGMAHYVQARHTMCRRGILCVSVAYYVQAKHTVCKRGILCVGEAYCVQARISLKFSRWRSRQVGIATSHVPIDDLSAFERCHLFIAGSCTVEFTVSTTSIVHYNIHEAKNHPQEKL